MTLQDKDRTYILRNYAKNDINFVRGEGVKLFDAEGKEYIDFASGIGVNSVGYGHPHFLDAVCEQAKRLIHVSNLFMIQPQIELAERIVALSGYDMACFFANSGAEANEAAIKIARKYGETQFEKKRYKIITLEHSFHGRTITTVKATGQEHFHSPHFSPYPDGFTYVPTLSDVISAIDDETVGVLIELVQGEGGVQPLDKAEVQRLASYLKEKGILFIVDEVQTGVYRTGAFLASNLYEIEPDIVTLAKGLGGGIPIGVAMTKHKTIFSPGDHGSTFGGNYLSTRAGLAVTDILSKRYEDGRLDEAIEHFHARLQETYKRHQAIFGQVVGVGMMRGLRTYDGDTLSSIIKASLSSGVVVLKAGRNTVRFLPPLTISKDEIDEGFARFEKALNSL